MPSLTTTHTSKYSFTQQPKINKEPSTLHEKGDYLTLTEKELKTPSLLKMKGQKPWQHFSPACQSPEKCSHLERGTQATESIDKSTTSNNITARNLYSTEYYIEDNVKNSHPTHHQESISNPNNTNNFYIEQESNSEQSEENTDVREDAISPEIFFNQTEDITERIQPRKTIPRLNAAWRTSFCAAL